MAVFYFSVLLWIQWLSYKAKTTRVISVSPEGTLYLTKTILATKKLVNISGNYETLLHTGKLCEFTWTFL